MKKAEILIVDDVDAMRALLEHLIRETPELAVSGLARNVTEARREIQRNRPDLVLLDEVLPGESSADLLREVAADGLAVLLLTGITDATHAVAPGALGRLVKPTWESLDSDLARFRKSILDTLKSKK